MEHKRIIARLDIKGPNVVKGIRTEGLRILGAPKDFARKYYTDGADEMLYIDIVASLYQRNLDFDLLRSVADSLFIPLTVGGGIRSVHDINNALRAGADKVAINTFATRHPEFLSEAVKKFGSQCVVLFVEAKKTPYGTWEAYTDGGREKTGIDAISWIKQAIDRGVGEVLLTSIDRDGTRAGFETDLITAVTAFSPIPVIAHGGAGTMESIADALVPRNASAVAASSVFHYGDFSIRDLKRYLQEKNIAVRNL